MFIWLITVVDDYRAYDVWLIRVEKINFYTSRLQLEAPQLAALLKEMKEGLDTVRNKVQSLTAKVKANQFPTADGISYLEAKHLLLLNYCQSLVYYLLRKARGLSIEGHPVVRSLVEIRLFLEKVRPVDKKIQYQIEKLTRVTASAVDKVGLSEKEEDATQKTEDPLKYRPNPDMLNNLRVFVLLNHLHVKDGAGVYRPPKFAPTSMVDDKISKLERNALRKEKDALRQARQSAYVRDLMDDLQGKPEEVREIVGAETREVTRYKAKMEDRARREEELFNRVPLTKMEKKKMKHLKKSRNGLLGLTESFYDDIRSLPLEQNDGEEMTGFLNDSSGKRSNKRKSDSGVSPFGRGMDCTSVTPGLQAYNFGRNTKSHLLPLFGAKAPCQPENYMAYPKPYLKPGLMKP
ncbi:Sas10/Utp3/C1D family [Actinidia rufa]|uniref:Sas10/Utp3/C1D family n=1 Tax=Actinidia rufa TaxID=165716 RepID=A0A7J0FBS4_9ERIC|nr:Sas10/Utp3/C1D family [Actinidia rufa]